MVTGSPSITSKRARKSALWNGSNLSRACWRSSVESARIISCTTGILSSEKNICSVRQRPIPSAPNFRACLASRGVSALARTLNFLISSAQDIYSANSPDSSGSMVATGPSITSPVEPFKVMISFSLIISLPIWSCFLASLTRAASQPATQHFPMPRATTAAWEVIPPREVSIPAAACIPSISSGLVSCLTRITGSPPLAALTAASAVKYIAPDAAPGDAGSPRAMTSYSALGSRRGCNNWSSCAGSSRIIASSLVISFSLTISTAIFNAACTVLLPVRVCSMYNFPC